MRTRRPLPLFFRNLNGQRIADHVRSFAGFEERPRPARRAQHRASQHLARQPSTTMFHFEMFADGERTSSASPHGAIGRGDGSNPLLGCVTPKHYAKVSSLHVVLELMEEDATMRITCKGKNPIEISDWPGSSAAVRLHTENSHDLPRFQEVKITFPTSRDPHSTGLYVIVRHAESLETQLAKRNNELLAATATIRRMEVERASLLAENARLKETMEREATACEAKRRRTLGEIVAELEQTAKRARAELADDQDEGVLDAAPSTQHDEEDAVYHDDHGHDASPTQYVASQTQPPPDDDATQMD